MDKTDKKSSEKEEGKPIVAKTLVDVQRLKLMKLMKNPDKPVIIPERPKPKNTPTVPEFVRNVMGSSAGAGSGEFHVYRHLRRKEYARQKFIQDKGRKELMDLEYQQKLEENKKKAEEITAKKRAKRLRKKEKQKNKPKRAKIQENEHNSTESENENNSEKDDVLEQPESVPDTKNNNEKPNDNDQTKSIKEKQFLEKTTHDNDT